MATIKRELSHKVNGNGKSEIILRLTVGRGLQPRLKSGLFINPSRFNDGQKDPLKAGSFIIPRANQNEAAELRILEMELVKIEQYLLTLSTTTPREQLNKEFFEAELDKYLHPDKQTFAANESPSFFIIFEKFLKVRELSNWRIRHYEVLIRALKRFEAYKVALGNAYSITLDDFSEIDIMKFESFLRSEPEIAKQYPDIYAANPADSRTTRKIPKPLPKGHNTIVSTFSQLRAFFNWCNAQGLTNNRPFAKYNGIHTERYGRPYYISTEERDIIANFNLSDNPSLATQRDIFIFQCLIGCRVSDLMRMTQGNIINGAVEYIATKTQKERPEVIRVPLHERAAALIQKYAGIGGNRLFPFISPQRYNDAIKEIFTRCNITRAVTVINPTTGEEEKRPINEIASSHLARRTFIGNLYKQVKDPNLVGSLSGHKEGSRAFTRYRDIDDEMKKEIINLL